MTINSSTPNIAFSTSSIKAKQTSQTNNNTSNVLSKDSTATITRGWHTIGFETESDRRRALHAEHYAKVNEENKKFADPIIHMHDKYKNPLSPYYIEDLTDEERDIASNVEYQYFKYGSVGSMSYADPVFRDSTPFLRTEELEKKAYSRQIVNGQFQQLLDSHNITIPKGTKLNIELDPNNNKVTVSGTDDIELKKSIERALSGDNANGLFGHIIQIRLDIYASVQETNPDEKNKYDLIRKVEKATGYNLKDLDLVDGKFLTKDGRDIFKIHEEIIRNDKNMTDETKSIAIRFLSSQLENAAKAGIDSVPDLVLSIEYENGSFYDGGQRRNYGTGKTDWIDELKSEELAKALSEREEYTYPSNRKKVNNQFQELLNSNNITIPQGINLRFTINPYTNEVSINGPKEDGIARLLEILNEESTKGLMHYLATNYAEESKEVAKEKAEKFDLIREMKEVTGYDLKDLVVANGELVTKGGTVISEIYTVNINNDETLSEWSKQSKINSYGSKLEELAKDGLSSISDLVLSINFENGSFKGVEENKISETWKLQEVIYV